MQKKIHGLMLFVTFGLLIFSAPAAEKKKDTVEAGKAENAASGPGLLWRDPTDIASRNLFYGPGGEEHQPHGPYTFVKEDLNGTNPKFDVHDPDGVKWRVKLGEEARPETVATRLVWAVGYFANEDYSLPDFRAEQMPPHLKRGQKLVAADGSVHNVRLKRYLKGEKKVGTWKWRDNPFTGRGHGLHGERPGIEFRNHGRELEPREGKREPQFIRSFPVHRQSQIRLRGFRWSYQARHDRHV